MHAPPAQELSTRSKTARHLTGFIGLAAVLDTAVLPGPSVGVALDGGLEVDWFRLEAQVAVWGPRTAAAPEGASGSFAWWNTALLACVEPSASELSVFGCGGLELGRLSAEGRGVSNPGLGSIPWTAARLELGLGFKPKSTLRLSARLGVATPFERRQFILDGEVIHETPALSVRAGIGIDFLL